jgi:hypothetical protein
MKPQIAKNGSMFVNLKDSYSKNTYDVFGRKFISVMFYSLVKNDLK